MTYAGNQITLQSPHQSSETIVATVTKLDPKRDPKHMDFVRRAGPNVGTTIQAIYEFQGPDKHRVCFDPFGTGRPTGFTSGVGGCRYLHIWQRVKTP
jgi:uncharacterized protein (TIGR03067 family)